jgi:U3 small nucleolar RNA-associated protein 22
LIHAVHVIHHQFGPAVRLAKNWIHTHFFSDTLQDEAIEILVASLFLHPQPFSPPHAQIPTFLRFLQLLSTFDWEHVPLILEDSEHKFTPQEHRQIQKQHENIRQRQPMFLVTWGDRESVFTINGPSKQMLGRLVTIASAHLEMLKRQLGTLLSRGEVRKKVWKDAFRPNLVDFDVIVELKAPKEQLKGKNLTAVAELSNFVEEERYVREVKARYSHLGLIFHDKLKQNRVGIVWMPSEFLPQPFKPLNTSHSLPLNLTEKIEFVDPSSSSSAEEKNKKNQKKKTGDQEDSDSDSDSDSDDSESEDEWKKKEQKKGGHLVLLPNITEIVDDLWNLGKGLVKNVIIN